MEEGYRIQPSVDFLFSQNKKELVDIFLENEYLEGKPTIPMINDLRRKLQGSLITKSKQHRLKMLLNDINGNGHRVLAILTPLNDAQDARDISNILEQLVVSHEQYQKLVALQELYLPAAVEVIK